MAYDTDFPPIVLGMGGIGGARANNLWHYTSDDPSTDVDASGYFTDGFDLGMKVGDVMFVIDADDTFLQTTHSVTVVDAATGLATISAAT